MELMNINTTLSRQCRFHEKRNTEIKRLSIRIHPPIEARRRKKDWYIDVSLVRSVRLWLNRLSGV